VALNVFNAYRLAKEQVSARMRELLTTHLELGLLPEQAGPALRVDAYPYGVKSNQALLETAARYSHEQGLTPRVVQMNEVFAPSTLDL
jgi:4,5-dihydroxyphthalate decarboxylase